MSAAMLQALQAAMAACTDAFKYRPSSVTARIMSRFCCNKHERLPYSIIDYNNPQVLDVNQALPHEKEADIVH